MQRNNAFGLELVVDGRVLPVIQHGGKNYVAAPWDKDFQVRLNVPFGGRYLAVTSVDGLDIMTGKTASKEAGGYVLSGYSNNDIPGFRLNNSEVAAFHFGDRADSYAAQLDKPAYVGVIAVIFYEEVRPVRHVMSMSPRGGCLGGGGGLEGTRGGTFGGGATKGGLGHDMGTEFGQRKEHKVTNVDFKRGREVARFVIEYASRESLIKAGVITDAPLGEVNPFPGDRETGCKPPKGWRG